MPITPPPIQITGTVLSMAHASGNKWVDEVSGNNWSLYKCDNNYSSFNTDRQLSMDGLVHSAKGRLKNKPYAVLNTTQLIGKNIPDNILAADDFTISIWINVSTYQCPDVLMSAPTRVSRQLAILYNQGYTNIGTDGYSYCPAGRSWIFYSRIEPELKKWHHCALTKKGTTAYFFLDGKLLHTNPSYDLDSLLDNTIATSALSRRHIVDQSAVFTKFYDEIVIIKGQTLWTEDFDPKSVNFGYNWTPMYEDIDTSMKLY